MLWTSALKRSVLRFSGLEAQLAVITRDQLAQVIAQIPTAEARADLDNYTNDYEALYGSGNDPVEIVFFKLFDELNARPVSAENTAIDPSIRAAETAFGQRLCAD